MSNNNEQEIFALSQDKWNLYIMILSVHRILKDYGFNYSLDVKIDKNNAVEIFLSNRNNKKETFFYLYAVDINTAFEELSFLEYIILNIVKEHFLERNIKRSESEKIEITKILINKLEELSNEKT